MGRHKNLNAIVDCSVLKGDSDGEILNTINVILVMLKDKEFVLLLVAWEATHFHNQLQNDGVSVEAQHCCYHQGSSLFFG